MTINGLFASLLFLAVTAALIPQDDRSCFLGNAKIARECCLMPRYIDKDIDDACTTKHRNPGPRMPPWALQTEGSCVVECIFTELDSFRNNSIDGQALKDAFVKAIGLNNLFGIITNNSVDHCHEQIMNNSDVFVKPVSPDPEREGCSFVPTVFLDCFKENVFMNCPKEKWIASAECNALRLKITSGCSFKAIKGYSNNTHF